MTISSLTPPGGSEFSRGRCLGQLRGPSAAGGQGPGPSLNDCDPGPETVHSGDRRAYEGVDEEGRQTPQ